MPLEKGTKTCGVNENGRHVKSLPLIDSGETDVIFSRRDFLRLAGFAAAGATLAGCRRAAVQHAVPYLTAPAEIIPGRSYQYASTCSSCSAGCGLLVQNRDGRPIKLEGNPDHPLSRGGLCAVGQASLLGLYDQQRLTRPLRASQPADWSDIDRQIVVKLETIRRSKDGAVRVLAGPGLGPTTQVTIQHFLDSFPDGRLVISDSHFCSAILEAHARTHGARLLPHYRFEKAETIVGFNADFLGTWISPVEFAAAYQTSRRPDDPKPRMSYHVQFEPILTLTGSKADRHISLAPGELAAVMYHLAERLAIRAATPIAHGENMGLPESVPVKSLDNLADLLWQQRQRSLIVCGSTDVELQVLTNLLNHLLGNYNTTVDIAQPSYQHEADDGKLQTLRQELREGKVAAVFVHQCNPVHDLPGGEMLAEDLKRVPLFVSLSPRLDETAQIAQYVCPDHHYLESWNDAEPVNGIVSVAQPAINPLGNTRSVLESFAVWQGKPRASYDLVREHWEKEIFPRQTQSLAFSEFWDSTVHDGVATVKPRPTKTANFNLASVRPAPRANAAQPGTFSLVLYSKVAMPNSSHAYNPWLHELPDPISKVTWDNYVCVSPASAASLNVTDGDVLRLEASGEGNRPTTLELPAFIQPGIYERVVAVALGFGSVLSRRFADIGPKWLQARPTVGGDGLVGKNAASFLHWADGSLHTTLDNVRVTKTGTQYPLASTQTYNQISVPQHLALPGQERRHLIHETTLSKLMEKTASETTEMNDDLWANDHPVTGPRWGMVIDLNACTGCSACVIACQAENNIPVVGKDEVRRQREMHWLRIDRYYSEEAGEVAVAHQPMLCHHCGNAPCEVVCPVLATVHSEEGLNQQIYNRCVGTRYCANNCPYKVRRFNWFDYAHDDNLQNLVLNPDVTVRSRGVMEKCTFCVQRIQEAEIESTGNRRRLKDGIVQTACQQSCPAQAIVFGDLNDSKSRVARLAALRRSYQVLAELNVKPAVSYLSIVRNRPAEEVG
jgi:molybdopterin-containing oxidoreductase family iron-sulfur binding subunit